MKEKVLEIKNIAKEYEVGKVKSPRLKEWITFKWKQLFSRTYNSTHILLALNNISFDVYDGEIVGIIGHNGSGKSTLLKILSQITSPSGGEVKIRGRVASLIEVGTGFHKELTGRENIFINGAILGMKRTEIKSKLEQIIDFSELSSNLIDTPIKKYSSGMKIRLAFSIAAHLSADLLLMDEILAVSDIGFQEKSLSKLKELAQNGKTILFVSHDLAAIKKLCTRCVFLNKGKLIADGNVDRICKHYLDSLKLPKDFNQELKSFNYNFIKFYNLEIKTPHVEQKDILIGDALSLTFKYFLKEGGPKRLENVQITLFFQDKKNTKLFNCGTNIQFLKNITLEGEGEINCTTAPLNLSSGQYKIELQLNSKRHNLRIPDFGAFTIHPNHKLLSDSNGSLMIVDAHWKLK